MTSLTENEAIQLLERYKRKGSMWHEDVIEAALYLARMGNTHQLTLEVLSGYVKDGALFTSSIAARPTDISAVYYGRVRSAFAQLAQTQPKALEFLTDEIIDGFHGTPRFEYEGLLSTFLSVDPRRALPETRRCIKRILDSDVGRAPQVAERFRTFRSRMPRSGIFGF